MAESRPHGLRQWRAQKNLTMQEVSDLTGLSLSYVSRLESGNRTAPPMTKVLMARRLGVAVAEIFPIDEVEGNSR